MHAAAVLTPASRSEPACVLSTGRSATSQKLAFSVFRSRMGNLPIYTDRRGGGRTKHVTILRKYAGDVDALKAEVERVCERPAVLYHGRMEVKGDHKEKLWHWLSGLGF